MDIDTEQFERVRMAGVAKQNIQKAGAPRPRPAPEQRTPQDAATDAVLAETVGQGQAADDDPAGPWRRLLGADMARFEGMDTMRRNAFMHGVQFAVSSIQLAACNTEAAGAPAAAGAFRHVAAQISGAALNMKAMPRSKKKRRLH